MNQLMCLGSIENFLLNLGFIKINDVHSNTFCGKIVDDNGAIVQEQLALGIEGGLYATFLFSHITNKIVYDLFCYDPVGNKEQLFYSNRAIFNVTLLSNLIQFAVTEEQVKLFEKELYKLCTSQG